MAQVTISGKFGTAYTSAEASDGTKVSGFQVTDGDLRVTASEDLGGGVRATVAAEFGNRGRANANAARDATITLSGGFGSITAGAVEAGNGITGLGNAGAPVRGLDNSGQVLQTAVNVDMVRYTLPTLVKGLGASISLLDGVGDVSRNSGNITQVALTFSNGPLSIAADRSDYNKSVDYAGHDGTCQPKGNGTISPINKSSGAGSAAACVAAMGTVLAPRVGASSGVDYRNRISASYDFGVARIGYGFQTIRHVTATVKDDVQSTMGVSVPLGAITLGAVRSTQKVDGAATKKTGNEFGLNYAFSKTTNLQASMQSFKSTGDATSTKYTRVRLLKSF
jgi:hypothetical protein